MKKVILMLTVVISTTFFTKNVSAQDYNASIGLSLGAPLGIDYKQFFSARSAINATFGYTFAGNSITVGAVYQYHFPLTDGLNLYVGGGLNFGAIHTGKYYNSEFLFGITPNTGLEYKFDNAPFVLALDYRPSINFTTHSQWNQAALKVRYTF